MSPAGGETRRSLLMGSAVGAGATLLAGCGGGGHHRNLLSPSGTARDVELLNGVLAAEQRTIALYTAGAPLLTGFPQKMATHFLGQELEHAGILRKLLKHLHDRAPHRPDAHYDFGQPRGSHEILALIHELELAQVSAYLRTIPRLTSPMFRQALAAIMANDAQHITVLRVELGLPALTGAFLNAAE